MTGKTNNDNNNNNNNNNNNKEQSSGCAVRSNVAVRLGSHSVLGTGCPLHM